MSAVILASTENMTYSQWLERRRSGIGGSDASVVCGINKWKSPVELLTDTAIYLKKRRNIQSSCGRLKIC